MRLSEWEQLATEGKIKDAVVAYVRAYDWVTFTELDRHFSPFLETKGNKAITFDDPNLIVWCDMSETWCDLLLSLLQDRRVFMHGASELTYLLDGGVLRLPVAKQIRKQGYKTERWLPVCLRVVPIA